MARYFMIVVALLGSVLADDSGYAAPSQGYGAPSQGYGAPSAPADNYGVPSYGEPTGYAVQADEGNDLFNLDKLITLIPFFLAVFAAIIIAQIFAPLIGMLFDAKVGLLAPFGAGKIDVINSILGNFNLALCNITPVLAVAEGREFANGFNLNPELVSLLSTQVYKAFENYSK